MSVTRLGTEPDEVIDERLAGSVVADDCRLAENLETLLLKLEDHRADNELNVDDCVVLLVTQ
jgi:hypothetical protein